MTQTQTAEITMPMLVGTRAAPRPDAETAAERAADSFEAIRASSPRSTSEGHELTEQQALDRLDAITRR